MSSARRIVDAVPRVMRELRREMRGSAAPDGLTVPQLRILIQADRHPGTSVTQVAEHLGVTVPTASVAVNRLVRQGWLHAESAPGDRRRLALRLSAAGQGLIDRAMLRTVETFAQRLRGLSYEQLDVLDHALGLLSGTLFQAAGAAVVSPAEFSR